ncbi:FAD dependent oxidoreductase-domain-containing protein [Naematelia encephala]|uniref:FAD dependent oxidoreductase-domain-containing protein n=1 Tax=Naematelia encephala TaxID=71784 RepID=A0A1Y2ARQ7_9TREE|nr:FAD dependent oxidoreductase-domain-containing protein [Naematelia encephala]
MVLPCTNPCPSFWIEAASSPLRDHRSTKDLQAKTDVLIIGSGYSGASIAYWLTKYTDSPPSITILEARDVCGGATGRNGGQLKPDWYISYPKWSALYGRETALSLSNHERAHLRAFTELLAEEDIDCSFRAATAWEALMSDVEMARVTEAYESLRDIEGQEAVSRLTFIKDPEEAERVTRIKGAVGAMQIPAGQIWPYKFVHGLLTRLLDRKLINLQAHTPATHVSSHPDTEGYIAVTTPRGVIRAKRVVHATNRWASHLLPQFEGIINPALATICAVKASPYYVEKPWESTVSIRWDGVINNYLSQFPPPLSTIIIGGAKEVLIKDPSSFIGSDAEDRLIPGVEEYFKGIPKRDFIGWDGPDVADLENAGVWTGVLASSVDAMPFVGKMPNYENQYIQACFHGHGMPRILGSSAHTTSLILDSLGISYSTPRIAAIFPPLPSPFQLTQERLSKVRAAADKLKEASGKASIQLPKVGSNGVDGTEMGTEKINVKEVAGDVEGYTAPLVDPLEGDPIFA